MWLQKVTQYAEHVDEQSDKPKQRGMDKILTSLVHEMKFASLNFYASRSISSNCKSVGAIPAVA